MIYRCPRVPIQGWMSLPELQWLYHEAKKYRTIAEIGCWKGKSTHALLSGALQGGGTVTAIDHFEGTEIEPLLMQEVANADIYHLFMANVGRFPNLKVIKLPSKEAAEHLGPTEMTFIDGGHLYPEVVSDLDLYLPKTTKLICGHDYNFPQVKQAVIERFGVPEVIDTIWYVRLEDNHDPA